VRKNAAGSGCGLISGYKNFVGGSEDNHGGPLSCSFFRQIGRRAHVYSLVLKLSPCSKCKLFLFG